MELYGLYVWTHHGWGTVLTVMSPEGADVAFAHIETDEDIIASGGDGRLPRYMGRRAGALDKLIARYGIQVLDKAGWDAKKAELAAGNQSP
jgi:hypothetical protein